ncbi:MAG: hypothetical protein Q4D76_20155 [Oscillospiraceae bacterium]|nr:hypothetical protein [Oscillospiraceae bacterium]
MTNTTLKGPSISNGCCGWLIFGPVGLLFSFCGMRSKTEEYWICHSCGSKFQSGDYESKLQSKVRYIEDLQRKIESLEESLKNKPEDFDRQFEEATQEYHSAKERHDQFQKSFFSTSILLRTLNVLYYLLPGTAILFTTICVLAMLSSLEIINGIVLLAIGSFITLALITILETFLKKAQKRIDPEKASELNVLWDIYQDKEKSYKKLKKFKDNMVSYEKTKKELSNAEHSLEIYKKNGGTD